MSCVSNCLMTPNYPILGLLNILSIDLMGTCIVSVYVESNLIRPGSNTSKSCMAFSPLCELVLWFVRNGYYCCGYSTYRISLPPQSKGGGGAPLYILTSDKPLISLYNAIYLLEFLLFSLQAYIVVRLVILPGVSLCYIMIYIVQEVLLGRPISDIIHAPIIKIKLSGSPLSHSH